MFPHRFRRAISISIPLFTALLFLGVINAFFDLNASTNIANTGVSIGFIVGILNAILTWMIVKHRVP